MSPKVSVIIPVYNASLTIERAITSALNQDLQPFEILIYDDCSTDNSYERISVLMDEFDSIKYYKGEKNVGAGSSRDFLLKLAKGDFIAFLDSDDFWHKSKLEKQINALIFHKLLAQMIWYFIEGVQCRFDEYPVDAAQGFTRYTVQMSDRELVFLKSSKSQRWWMEFVKENYLDNKTRSSALLSCTHQDYLNACNDILPDRWWRATKRS